MNAPHRPAECCDEQLGRPFHGAAGMLRCSREVENQEIEGCKESEGDGTAGMVHSSREAGNQEIE